MGGTAACPGVPAGCAGWGGSYPPGLCLRVSGCPGLRDAARPEAPGALLPFYCLVSSSLGERAGVELGAGTPTGQPPGCCDSCSKPPEKRVSRPIPRRRRAAVPARHAARAARASSGPLLRLPWKWPSQRSAKRIRASSAASRAAPAPLGPRVTVPRQIPSLSQTCRAALLSQHSWAQTRALPHCGSPTPDPKPRPEPWESFPAPGISCSLCRSQEKTGEFLGHWLCRCWPCRGFCTDP